MSENAEHVIRQWGRSDGDGPQTPAPPTQRCLTFEQAAAIARSAGLPDGEARRHLAECPRCRQAIKISLKRVRLPKPESDNEPSEE